MKYILFANKQYGVDFMLIRQLNSENIPYNYISFLTDRDLYTKHNIKSTPVLISFDDDGAITGRLSSIAEIVEYLKTYKEHV